MNGRRNCLGVAISAALIGLVGGVARAQQTMPSCNDATMVGPNPLYLNGSSAFQPTAQAMALALQQKLTGNDRVTLVYDATSSCDGPTVISGTGDISGGTATYFTFDMTATPPTPIPLSCALAAGTKSDVGISDIFYETCPGIGARPANVGDIGGPVQAMLFIVPKANTTFTYITAEEAQLIWGCGMAGMVSPFTDDNGIQQRNMSSGTQGIIATVIGVPPTAFKGHMNNKGGDLVTSLLGYAATNPDKAIGFLAADSYDQNRTSLNSLAFRGFNQQKAYYADSDASSFDRKNVRDGHYVAWGPEHMIVTLGSDGKPNNPNAIKWLGWLDGSVKVTGIDFTQIEAQAGVIPQCAMKVKRSADGGPVSPMTAADNPDPCGCFFESITMKTATPTGCTPCTDDSACTAAGKTCHYNFCE
jgi:ABC-type phosphate transport system substrate-binding protein